MSYISSNYYMIRTPCLSIKYYMEFTNSKKDIYHFIKENNFLDLFFTKALFVTSKTLYMSYTKGGLKGKKYKNMCNGLLKYFIRATTRPTPFGYFSDVSLGEFNKTTKLIKSNNFTDVGLDINWVNKFIVKIEQNHIYLEQLDVKFNNICFISGDRLKNPCYSFRGIINNTDKILSEISIKNTDLIKIIKEKSINFISYNDLVTYIVRIYNLNNKELIYKTLNKLIENEILITNLRLPAYCNDELDYIGTILSKLHGAEIINYSIEKIKHLLDILKKNNDINTLKAIVNIMSELCESENYLRINSGAVYDASYLSIYHKNTIENFANNLECIFFQSTELTYLKKFTEQFLEIYGKNVEVKLSEVIDNNKFGGYKFIDLDAPLKNSEREQKISSIIYQKIDSAIYENKNVYLFKDDFINIDNKNITPPQSFDMNFFVLDGNIILGPNVGSSRAGAMFQRFSRCFDIKKFNEFNNEIKINSNDINYSEVELRENVITGKGANILNNKKNTQYYLPIGLNNNVSGSITIEELFVGIDDDFKLYIKSNKTNKKIRFIKNNMLNPRINSKLFQLLYCISESYEDKIIERFYEGYNRLYIPRIYFENVIISLKKWNLGILSLRLISFELFKLDFTNLQKKYRIERFFYLIERDNRLVIDSLSEIQLKLVFDCLKKNQYITISEIEPGLFKHNIVFDSQSDIYNAEFVFSFYKSSSKFTNKDLSEITFLNRELIHNNRIVGLSDDGWLYLKLYGVDNRIDEILSIDLLKLISELGNPCFFYIRYYDSKGLHIRLRIKFKDKDSCIARLNMVLIWAEDLKKRCLITNLVIDDYIREINRYGGRSLIELCENIFFNDSLLCIMLLSADFSKDKVENEFIFFIIYTLKISHCSLNDALLFLDKPDYKNNLKDYYNKNKKRLSEFGENVWYENNRRCEVYNQLLTKNIQKLTKYYSQNINLVTNGYNNIIASIIHMHCNRLVGDNDLEMRYMIICRHIIYDLFNKEKNTI